MNYLYTTILLLFILPQAQAMELKIEPVYGVERTLRLFPEPAKYRTEVFYGVRGLYGTPGFSLELELNESKSNEQFPDEDLKVDYLSRKALLGFRSYLAKTSMLGFFVRFGARAEKKSREIEEAGVKRTEDTPLSFDPYAGVGITIVASTFFALNAGATMVYNKNAEDESEKYDTRYSFSFSVKAGSK
ncbi:MAG: hypothetical protein ACJAS4_003399 [Bacteriovoracaceae bacterium]|jgi:hypothetical protein